MTASLLADLRQSYPYIDWGSPVTIKVVGKEPVLACRVCVAMIGVAADDIGVPGSEPPWIFGEEEDFRVHFEEQHV